jgi:prepilin-type N-terminal cleavage/methylation domain-containing protein
MFAMRTSLSFRSLLHARSGAFTLVEVLVAMALILIGVAAAAVGLQQSVRETDRAVDTTIAAYLAQMKAEEIRRDDDSYPVGDYITTIRSLTQNQATALVTWPQDNRFAYGFCGVSMLDPTTDSGVARVIICYSPEFKPRANQYDSKYVLYELKF